MKIKKACLFSLIVTLSLIFSYITYGKDDMQSFFKMINPPTRNDYSGLTGIEFTTNEDINIIALGRPVTVIFKQEHTITLWSTKEL